MIVDCHNHIGLPWEKGFARQSAEELIERMNKAGVDRCVAFPFPQFCDNLYIVQSVKKFPDRIIGFANINPLSKPDADKELEHLIQEQGLKGLKLHPVWHGFPVDDLILLGPIFTVCSHLKIPVLIHSGDNILCTPLQFEELAKEFPNVTIIMAHSGFMNLTGQALRVAKRNRNIVLDMTAATSLQVTEAIEVIGPARVLMGSDTPFMHFEVEMKKMELAVPDIGQRKLVMGGNIMRIIEKGA